MTEEFSLDWAKAGVYELKWGKDMERVEALTHVPFGKTVNIASYGLGAASQFGGNHSDMLAFFKKDRQELPAAGFWEED